MIFVNLLSLKIDDATDILIPNKYRRVVLDGMLELAYAFDPDLGDDLKQRAKYPHHGRKLKKTDTVNSDSESSFGSMFDSDHEDARDPDPGRGNPADRIQQPGGSHGQRQTERQRRPGCDPSGGQGPVRFINPIN